MKMTYTPWGLTEIKEDEFNYRNENDRDAGLMFCCRTPIIVGNIGVGIFVEARCIDLRPEISSHSSSTLVRVIIGSEDDFDAASVQCNPLLNPDFDDLDRYYFAHDYLISATDVVSHIASFAHIKNLL